MNNPIFNPVGSSDLNLDYGGEVMTMPEILMSDPYMNEGYNTHFQDYYAESKPAHSYLNNADILPAIDSFRGDFDFHLVFGTVGSKQWSYSVTLNKLFCDRNTSVAVQFHVDTDRIDPSQYSKFRIRAVPVFAKDECMSEPVARCVIHTLQDENVPHNKHLIWSEHSGASYNDDLRKNVCMPLEHPHAGTKYISYLFKFMCLNSCTGGINRRPVQVIFTLENLGTVVGRATINVRICSCPKRDMMKEERDQELEKQKGKKNRIITADQALVKDEGKSAAYYKMLNCKPVLVPRAWYEHFIQNVKLSVKDNARKKLGRFAVKGVVRTWASENERAYREAGGDMKLYPHFESSAEESSA